MNAFEYTRAASLTQAIGQLKDPHVVLKAGGVDLLDRIKEGLVRPSRLVDLSALRELDYVREDPKDGLHIGALTTLATLDAHPLVRSRYLALADAAGHAATPQIRNMATLGGNLMQRPRCWYFRSADFNCRKKGGSSCFALEGENQFHAIIGNQLCAAVHASTPATALVAFDARVRLTGPRGERELLLEEFLAPPEKDVTRENVVEPDEILTAVRVPTPAASARSAYHKQGEKESFDWPIADVAVVLELEGKACHRASLVLGALAPMPRRSREAESLLIGHSIDDKAAAAAAHAAIKGVTPLGKNGYKVQIFETIVRRTILAAAGGGS